MKFHGFYLPGKAWSAEHMWVKHNQFLVAWIKRDVSWAQTTCSGRQLKFWVHAETFLIINHLLRKRWEAQSPYRDPTRGPGCKGYRALLFRLLLISSRTGIWLPYMVGGGGSQALLMFFELICSSRHGNLKTDFNYWGLLKLINNSKHPSVQKDRGKSLIALRVSQTWPCWHVGPHHSSLWMAVLCIWEDLWPLLTRR